MNNAGAWDTGAADPGVSIDLDCQLDGTEFGSAYARWASVVGGQDHVASLARRGTPENFRMQRLPERYGHGFEAWLNRNLDNRHVARASSGTAPVIPLSLQTFSRPSKRKEEDVKKRKLQDESHGAGEPVWKLKLDADLARKALRDGGRLVNKLDSGKIQLHWLFHQQKELVEEFHARRLHVRVDRANVAYGHGIARTHDFGFGPEEKCVVTCPSRCEHHCELCRDLRSWWSKQWCCRAYC